MTDKKPSENWIIVVADRLTHLVVGMVSFGAIVLSIIIIHAMYKYVESLHVDEFTLFVLSILEDVFVLFDMYIILRYICRKVYADFNDND